MPSSTAEILKAELVAALAAMARERIEASGEADGPESAERFVRQCYDTIAPDDILGRDKEDLLGAALSLWRWGIERRPGVAKVRLYNPTRETHGWESPFTALEVVNDDMPFLVDSVTAALHTRDHAVQLVVHPVVGVRRTKKGVRKELFTTPRGEKRQPESYMQVEVARVFEESECAELRQVLDGVLGDVRAAVEDWKLMRERLREVIAGWKASPPPVDPEEITESETFLRWLEDDHFTFLGYRELDLVEEGGKHYLRLVPGSSLGVLRVREDDESHRLRPLTEKMATFARKLRLIFVTKANHRSNVHRPSHMDYIGVKVFDENGEVVGERRFLGLFTSIAYNRQARTIPLLQEKVSRTIKRAGFPPDSHDGKALLHILETYPRDELFQISEKRLFEISLGILQLQDRQRIALFVRRDPFERFVSCLVYAPRDRYNTELRLRMQGILEKALGGTVTAYYTQLDDSPLARVHYIVKTVPGAVPSYDVKRIEALLAEAARTWADHLYEALMVDGENEERAALFKRYRDAFPTSYRESHGVEEAVHHLGKVEEVLTSGRLGMLLYRDPAAGPQEMRFQIFHAGAPVPLSDVLPLLEHMGLRVDSEIPHQIRPAGVETPVWMHDFGLRLSDGGEVDFARLEEIFPQAFERIWLGEVENDGFNRLVVRAGLAWPEVVVLRAYSKFLRQAKSAFSQAYMQETLASSPQLAQLLIELFRIRFDPDRREGVEERMEEIQERIQAALAEVKSLDEDRILRRFLALIRHTLRTSFFQVDENGDRRSYVSFKLASSELKVLPEPRPLYEIFVYSPRMEAVHLRGGKVARGGVRWSDRREDFRTEILGLMKAQMVKNAVIVPVGAKGGFVLKRPPPPGDRDALLQEGIACYKTMIRGLLEITDNLVDGEIVPPQRVVRMDGDDPYLVVAADKGTAKFSDIANQLSIEYGFWLGDAFASGGSAGYDHKAMGITARGAWVAVERHFRELGTNIREEDFSVVGVGDMSGDVFGNGMLLSRHIRLLGAFNHLHVFVDPDPDPEISFAERQRLFGLPRSSWIDYDPKKLSPGGMVFDRSAKAVEPSDEIRALLGIKETSLPPNRLVQRLLTLECDLLWFGGIGTFVKGSEESHGRAGDRANDAVRVDADTLRSRVVGEGANLGITQAGRIEYALRGGKINTDAIDNSGGVDTSDHEVNIKILLGDVMARGELSLAERDRLLVEMTDEVAELVLRDNYRQTQAISVTRSQGVALLDAQQRMMRDFERAGTLDRALESLPDDEALAARAAARIGLTRPEVAILLALSKIDLYGQLLESTLLDDPLLLTDLELYFPAPIRERYAEAIGEHRLRREIIATHTTNSMVNRVGPTFVSQIVGQTGAGPADVARAYTIVRESFDLRTLWAGVEALDYRIPAEIQLHMMVAIGRLVERLTLWFLRNRPTPLDISANTREFRPAVRALSAGLDKVLPRVEINELKRREKTLTKKKVPAKIARRVASLPDLVPASDIWMISRHGELEVEEVARVYFGLGDRLRLDWLREAARRLGAEGHWEKAALATLVDDLFSHQSALTRQVLTAAEGNGNLRKVIDAWAQHHRPALDRTERMIKEIRSSKSPDLAMLMVADGQLRRLVEEGQMIGALGDAE